MELHYPLPRSLSPLRICGLLFCLALLAGAASAASTDLKVMKLASDGKTVIAERTVDYRWLEANLPVKGDGSTHYYHQGPTFDDADLWDPTESKNVEDKDMGAVKGTALRDLCGLAGGMSSGDALLVRSGDGFSKRFSYGSVYSPSARQGQMVLTWFRAGEGYVPSYSTGMRVVFFADTSTNPWGKHVFGNADMKASMPSSEWHYFNGVYPTTTGLSIQSVSELRILSTQPAATTTAATVKPTTAAVTPAKSPTATAQATPQGTASTTTKPATTAGSTPAGTSVQPTVSAGTGIATASTVPSATVTSVVTAPYDDGGSVIVTTMPTATATVTTAPPTADAGTTTVQTPAPDATANATVNATASPTDSPVPTPTGYDHTYDYSVSTGLDYTADFEEVATGTATPTVAATATEPVTASPVLTAPPSPTPAVAPSPSPTAPPEDRASTRSLSFTLSFQVRESGNGPAVAADPGGSVGLVSPASPLGGLWASLKAVARLIDPFFT